MLTQSRSKVTTLLIDTSHNAVSSLPPFPPSIDPTSLQPQRLLHPADPLRHLHHSLLPRLLEKVEIPGRLPHRDLILPGVEARKRVVQEFLERHPEFAAVRRGRALAVLELGCEASAERSFHEPHCELEMRGERRAGEGIGRRGKEVGEGDDVLATSAGMISTTLIFGFEACSWNRRLSTKWCAAALAAE